jgi:hypothetical protein
VPFVGFGTGQNTEKMGPVGGGAGGWSTSRVAASKEFGQVRCPKFQLVLTHNLNDSDAKRGNKLAVNREDMHERS